MRVREDVLTLKKLHSRAQPAARRKALNFLVIRPRHYSVKIYFDLLEATSFFA